MERCKNCKNWEPPRADAGDDSGYGVCLQEIPDLGNLKPQNTPAQGLWYEDDGGCYRLWTGPMFGCVNFQNKGE